MALSVGRMRWGGYECFYLPSPLLTKEGKGGRVRIPLPPLTPPYKGGERRGGTNAVNKLPEHSLQRMTERNACGVSSPRAEREVLRGFGPAMPEGERNACGVSPPHGEVLLFRQKDPKPWAPGRGPSGAFAPVPKGLGCGTRFAQTVLAPN